MAHKQWRSQLIDCPGTVYITEIFPLYLKCCSFYHDHSILFAQEVCQGNQLAGYATAHKEAERSIAKFVLVR